MSDDRKPPPHTSPGGLRSLSLQPIGAGADPSRPGASPRAEVAQPRSSARERVRRTLRRVLPEATLGSIGSTLVRTQVKTHSVLGDPMQFRRASPARECPLCGHRGRFWSFGNPPRSEAMCPRCLSLERHRLLHLLVDAHQPAAFDGRHVLHFAPEGCIRERLARISRYVTADLSGRGVDLQCAMEAIPFPDGAIDTVIANHVLEHVDDDLVAMREVRRVLKPEGMAILSVPIIQGWDETYEDRTIVAPAERRTHFGQEDHKRMYGRDFADRLRRAGFRVEIFRADPASEIRYGLRRGDQFFLARPNRPESTAGSESPRAG